MVTITEKERILLTDLKEQEKTCIEKYQKNEQLAKDTVLKDLFCSIKQEEQQHLDSLNQVLNGIVPMVSKCNEGVNYCPTATYTGNYVQADKDNDCFLCTDSIATEKYVSGAYNNDLFCFSDTNIRKLLNDIQTEEQEHAEKIHIYKKTNQMV